MQPPPISEQRAVEIVFAVFIAVALLFLTGILMPSQPPAPSQRKESRPDERQRSDIQAKGDGADQSGDSTPSEIGKSDPGIVRSRKEDGEDSSKNYPPNDGWTTPMVILTGLVFLATVAQACFVWSQGKDTRLRQRAWVVIDDIDSPLKSNEVLRSTMRVYNTGETPAFIYRRIMDARIVPHDRDDLSQEISAITDEMDGAVGAVELILAPGGPTGQEHVFNTTHADFAVTPNFMNDIGPTGPSKLYLIGMLRYRDVFGQDHLSVCCYVWVGGDTKKFLGHTRHNQMT